MTRALLIFSSANRVMATMARSAGAAVTRDRSECTATLSLNPVAGLGLSWGRAPGGSEALVSKVGAGRRGRALLLHGAGGDCFQWAAEVIPQLHSAGLSVCAPALPGHGRPTNPFRARLDALMSCVEEWAALIDPTVVVGHSMGGYLVQRLLEKRYVPKAVLLASMPSDAREGDIAHVRSELRCSYSRAVIDAAMRTAPAVDLASARRGRFIVIGGEADTVVPKAWTQATARNFDVPPSFVAGGHQLLRGGSSAYVARAICA